jgi:hypothetical protein
VNVIVECPFSFDMASHTTLFVILEMTVSKCGIEVVVKVPVATPKTKSILE